MFVAFVDESGNDARSIVFAMATVLLCHSSSYYFGNEWTALLDRFGVVEYHASDFHRRRGNFEGWKNGRADAFQMSVVDLLLKWEVKHGGVVIPKADYKRSFADTGFHRLLVPAVTKWKKPYLQAFQHIVADLRLYAAHQPTGSYISPIFDDCQEFMGQAKQDYNTFNCDGKLGRMHVSNTREYVQLQAADFVVWEYRVGMERRLQTGDRAPGAVMEALLPHMFLAQIWEFDYLEYFRKRVEACLEGRDPDMVEAPRAQSTAEYRSS